MRYRITFVVPSGTRIMNGAQLSQDFEATWYAVEVSGALSIYSGSPALGTSSDRIICYAPGVWRSIADVGLLTKAVKREDSERRQEA